MKFKEIEKIIKKDGWKLERINGSHHHYKHPTKKGTVTIPRHNKDLRLGTVKSIFEQGEINYGLRK